MSQVPLQGHGPHGSEVRFSAGLEGQSTVQAIDPTNSLAREDLTDLIAAGDRHSCTLSGFKVRCWGANDQGQLGQGNTTPSGLPIEVFVPDAM